MIERDEAMRSNPVAYPRILSLPMGIVGIGYLVGYVLLDWISFIEPYVSFGITPWNPSTGLSFFLILLFGRRMIPFLFVSPLLADLNPNHLLLPWVVEFSFAILIGGGYSVALVFLLRPSMRFNPALSSMRDLVLLMLVAVVSTAFVASSFVAVTIAAGLLPINDFAAATLRYWVGDMIGIMVVVPFVRIALTRRRALRMSVETLLQFAAIIGALALVFGYAEEQQYQLFYVLFLPIVWMAVRTGTEGVTVGILITQLGLIVGIILFPGKGHDVTAYQTLMLVLATTGLVAGELVTEHRRTASQLLLHRDSLSHLARLGSMGELTAAIAHELNQPLMAAGTYTRLVDDAICSGNTDLASVAETAKKAVAQVERAAEVVRRLRALVRTRPQQSCPMQRRTNRQGDARFVPARYRSSSMPARGLFSPETFRPSWWTFCRSSKPCSISCATRLRLSARPEVSTVPFQSKLRSPAQTSSRSRSTILARDSRPISLTTRLFHFPPLRPKVSASACLYANRLSRPMAAASGWMEKRRAPPFTLRFPS